MSKIKKVVVNGKEFNVSQSDSSKELGGFSSKQDVLKVAGKIGTIEIIHNGKNVELEVKVISSRFI